MTTVPDRVLNWLYNSLRSEYHDPNRAYSHTASALSRYPSLSPRTEVHTFEDGASALLVLLQGTLPVPFRGTTYRFPIAVWIPHAYPKTAPMVFVAPTQEMAVRPGQHVSIEGKVYHPYLAHWAEHWDKSNLVDFLSTLCGVFAKEPPVISRQHTIQQQDRPHPPTQIPISPPVPPPPDTSARLSNLSLAKPSPRGFQTPPIPPPKTSTPQQGNIDSTVQGRAPGVFSPPPLPPKPGQQTRPATHLVGIGIHKTFDVRDGPALPPLPRHSNPPHQTESRALASGRESISFSQVQNQSAISQGSQYYTQVPQQQLPYAVSDIRSQQSLGTSTPTQPQPSRNSQNIEPKTKNQVPDLLSSALDGRLGFHASPEPLPPPPIPPNPEKDALLRAISTTLKSQLDRTLAQNTAAVPALESQNVAMQHAYQNMQDELTQLQQLEKMLSSNEKILHESMHEIDRLLKSVDQRELPAVDDVLVAPTIVTEQLYGLVADERSISDAMFVLTRALDKGRIGHDVFVKQIRSLAREQFLKKALIRKIAHGMGLTMPFNQ